MKQLLTFLVVLLCVFSARATVVKHHPLVKGARVEKNVSLTKEQESAPDNAEPLPIKEDDDEDPLRRCVARCVSGFYDLYLLSQASRDEANMYVARNVNSTSSCKYILQRVLRI